ncbi:MAG: haloacid dehalogenase type II [Brevirhabdus sp.]
MGIAVHPSVAYDFRMVQALIFDVFGTCVDWRSSVTAEVRAALPDVDAPAFATAWRAEYDPAMARVRDGNRGYVALDALHLENLEIVSQAFDIKVENPNQLNTAWERLAPWPDVVPGLTALKARHIIAPCSNGSIALMTRLGKFAGLPWDCILGADLARDYKPKPAVYHAACAALRLPADQVMMVAAHNSDLAAARRAGLKTGFVPRLTEHGAGQTSDLAPAADWDIIATDFLDLSRRLG